MRVFNIGAAEGSTLSVAACVTGCVTVSVVCVRISLSGMRAQLRHRLNLLKDSGSCTPQPDQRPRAPRNTELGFSGLVRTPGLGLLKEEALFLNLINKHLL